MITTIEPDRYFLITGHAWDQINDGLDAAVDKAKVQATEEAGPGILVTRHSPEVYTVALSASVPHGQTLERDNWVPHKRD